MTEEQQAAEVEPSNTDAPAPSEVTPESAAPVENSIPQGRFNQVIFKQRQAERERDEALQELNALKSTQTKPETPAPTLEGFDFDEQKFQSAAIQHEVAKQVQTNMDTFRQQEDQKQQQATAQQRLNDFNTKSASYAATNPDYEKDVQNFGNVQLEANLANAIVGSEKAPELHHHLLKNQDVLAKLESLPPVQQAMELGRIEASLNTTIEQKQTNAPAPIEPLGGSVSSSSMVSNEDIEKMTAAEYRAHREGQS